MASNGKKIAEIMGAKFVAELPDIGGGPFGAARMAAIVQTLQSRLQPGAGERPGRPSDATWIKHPKVPMSEATAEKLIRLAELASTPARRVSPMQMAAQLLEDSVARLSG